jgi:superfamily II DNA or RNA helicase
MEDLATAKTNSNSHGHSGLWLAHPELAENWWDELGALAQLEAERLWQDGAVLQVQALTPGVDFIATVRTQESRGQSLLHEVSLILTEQEATLSCDGRRTSRGSVIPPPNPAVALLCALLVRDRASRRQQLLARAPMPSIAVVEKTLPQTPASSPTLPMTALTSVYQREKDRLIPSVTLWRELGMNAWTEPPVMMPFSEKLCATLASWTAHLLALADDFSLPDSPLLAEARAAASEPELAPSATWRAERRLRVWSGWLAALSGQTDRLARWASSYGPWSVTTDEGSNSSLQSARTENAPSSEWAPWPAPNTAGWSIPNAALTQEAGLRVIEQLGVLWPSAWRKQLTFCPYEFTLEAQLTARALSGLGETVLLRLTARAIDGSRHQTYSLGGWLSGALSTHSSQPFHLYQDDDKKPLEAWFRALPSRYDPAQHQWRHGLDTQRAEQLETLSHWLRQRPSSLTLRLDPALNSLIRPALEAQWKLHLERDGTDWFELQAVLAVDDTLLTPLEIKTLIDAEGAWARIRSTQGWARLVDVTPPEVRTALTQAGLELTGLASRKRRLHRLALTQPELSALCPPEIVYEAPATLSDDTRPAVPSAIRATLRPYQIEGFHFLTQLTLHGSGGILADDMGLGKTLQTLTWIMWLRERQRQESPTSSTLPCLIVCPKSLTDNWRAEAQRFCPGLHVRVWRPRELRAFTREAPWAGLNIISYPQLRTLGEKIHSVTFLAAVLDEAQAIKNPEAAVSRLARQIQSQQRLALSGTPVENRLLDLWSIMAFALPGALGSRAHFERTYEGEEAEYVLPELRALLRPFILRRKKEDVAKDLPPVVEKELRLSLEGSQAALYQAELKRAQQHLLQIEDQAQFQHERFHVLTSLTRLRQLCCDPELVFAGQGGPSAKKEALFDLLDPLLAEGQKVLVFSQFAELLHLFRSACHEAKIKTWLLTGQTEHRGAVVDAFQKSETPGVFFISLKAGGSGLNLTQASHVIILDPWWNPAIEAQAIARAHRIGQQQTVFAYRLLIEDSVEEKIRLLQEHKAALASGLFDEGTFHKSLTLEEIRKILLT